MKQTHKTVQFCALQDYSTKYSETDLEVCDTLFRRVRKIAKSELLTLSCTSVYPSVRMEKLGYHWTDIHEILFEYISKISREIPNFITI
jgi:hypothetical protein